MVRKFLVGVCFPLASWKPALTSAKALSLQKPILLLLVLFATSSAITITSQPNITAIKQLSDFQNAAKPEYSAYLTAGLIYIPTPTQTRLQTEWGTHNGFAYRQNLGLWLTDKFDSPSSQTAAANRKFTFGLAWFGERQGWDNEDFLFFPHRGDFAIHRQIHTFAASIADSANHTLFGAGAQYLNHNDENFLWHLLGTWQRASVQAAFYKNDLKYLNAQLNLQARELRGDKNSWQNYLPDLEFSLIANDTNNYRKKIFISQNIYSQKLYVEGNFYLNSQKFSNAAIKFYPDPSRLLLAIDATATQNDNGNIFYGGGISIPFLRVAYNHSNDYDYFFKSRGLFVVEFRLAIGTEGDSFFGLNAPKSAKTEVSKKSVRKPVGGEN